MNFKTDKKSSYFALEEFIEDAQGIRSLLFISELARLAPLKVQVPPTLLLGFDYRNRFLKTDYKTGILKVVQDEMMDSDQVNLYIKKYMNHSLDKNFYDSVNISNTKLNIVCPLFILKKMNKGSTYVQIQVYYDKSDLISDIMCNWTKMDMVV